MRTLAHTINHHNLHPLALVVRPEIPAPAPVLSEAPCSVNGFFYLDGNGERFQATGRGFTPQEAAQNLADTIAATRQALAPQPAPEPVLQTREQQVGALLTCWLGKAVARKDFSVVERLAKGAALVLAGLVEMGNAPGVLAVRSATSPESWYDVGLGTTKSCTCEDYNYHVRKGEAAHACKHIAAACFYIRLT